MTTGQAIPPAQQIAVLEETNQDLEQQLANLQKREQANAELLATVSHEIRTPIGAIMTMVELLQTTQLSEKQGHYAKTLQLAARNLSTLTTDILNFARLEAGHVELENEQFSLPALIDTLVTAIKPRAQAKGLLFKCVIDPSCPTFIEGDQVRLSQVINNLANNALKFTEKGALHLTVSAHQGLQGQAGEQIITIEMKDTGIGMSKAEQQKIFTPFGQASSTIQTHFGGSGLGLWISRTLAQHMGGSLDFYSQKDTGSTFWFTFRATAVENPEIAIEQPSQQIDTISKDIATSHGNSGGAMQGHALIVEDNSLNQMLIKTYLDKFGLTYDCVTNGEEAIKAVYSANKADQERKYDIILMDVMMPVMDGITATIELNRIWQANNGGQIPVLALTANAMEDQVASYYAAGMDAYVSKPIRGEQLYQALEKLLSENRSDLAQIA